MRATGQDPAGESGEAAGPARDTYRAGGILRARPPGSGLTGIIEQGVDAGAHHTINVETGYEISVIKYWRPMDLETDRPGDQSIRLWGIHVLTIEEGEAELFRLRQYGPEERHHAHDRSGKGAETSSRTGFFEQILATIAEVHGAGHHRRAWIHQRTIL